MISVFSSINKTLEGKGLVMGFGYNFAWLEINLTYILEGKPLLSIGEKYEISKQLPLYQKEKFQSIEFEIY